MDSILSTLFMLLKNFWPLLLLIGGMALLLYFYPILRVNAIRKRISSALEELRQDGCKLVHNLIIESRKKYYTIDHVLISPACILVVKAMDMAGQITGNPQSDKWTQIIPRREIVFENPIPENKKAIAALKSKLDEAYPDMPYYSVIAFPKGTEVKVTEANAAGAHKLVDAIRLLIDSLEKHPHPVDHILSKVSLLQAAVKK